MKKCIKDNANIIFLSSSRVYSIKNLRKLINKNYSKPIKSKYQINEKFETNEPSSLYGFTKLASENLIKEFSYISKIKYIINRFGVIAGPWQFGKQDQVLFRCGLLNICLKKNFHILDLVDLAIKFEM